MPVRGGGAGWNQGESNALGHHRPFCYPVVLYDDHKHAQPDWFQRYKEGGHMGSLYNMREIPLRGEEDGPVPIFNTCDEIRRKIKLFEKRTALSAAGFLRGLARMRWTDKQYEGKSMTAASLQAFINLGLLTNRISCHQLVGFQVSISPLDPIQHLCQTRLLTALAKSPLN